MSYNGDEMRDSTAQRNYADGLRDGRIKTLEEAVAVLTNDVRMLNRAVYMLGGAIAVINLVVPLFEIGVGP